MNLDQVFLVEEDNFFPSIRTSGEICYSHKSSRRLVEVEEIQRKEKKVRLRFVSLKVMPTDVLLSTVMEVTYALYERGKKVG